MVTRTHFDISQPMIDKAKELDEHSDEPFVQWYITYTFMPNELEGNHIRNSVMHLSIAFYYISFNEHLPGKILSPIVECITLAEVV